MCIRDSSEEVGYKKPNPIIFNYALEKANAVNTSSLMIGDSYQADILGAINVGINAILFNYHNIDPSDDIISVNSLSDLTSYL